MRILLSNDDGILAPGLAAMYSALAVDAEVHVVAPESPQSAAAHAITIRHPLMCRPVHVGGRFHGTSVEGSPADCVKLAIKSLLPAKPDLVVSGINAGANVGLHVLYSGTVAAAAEGALLGCPAIAVSVEFSDEMDFDRTAAIARRVIDCIVQHGLQPRQLYNVNIPALRPGWPRGIRVVSQSIHPLEEDFERRTTPGGRAYYWLTGSGARAETDEGVDVRALRDGYICVTPLHFDLTCGERMAELAAWPWPRDL